MTVAVLTSVSAKIAELATLTVPNKLEYCLRHGYTLIAENLPYSEAIAKTDRLCHYLDQFDFLWCLDADAVITNMASRIDALGCLGPHATVCEEGIVEWNRLNCGSVVWRNTTTTRALLQQIAACRSEWESLACGWQTWLASERVILSGALAVAPLRSFNSCVWNRPGNGEGPPGSHWQKGDFVFHPCGVFPQAERLRVIADALQDVVR